MAENGGTITNANVSGTAWPLPPSVSASTISSTQINVDGAMPNQPGVYYYKLKGALGSTYPTNDPNIGTNLAEGSISPGQSIPTYQHTGLAANQQVSYRLFTLKGGIFSSSTATATTSGAPVGLTATINWGVVTHSVPPRFAFVDVEQYNYDAYPNQSMRDMMYGLGAEGYRIIAHLIETGTPSSPAAG